MNRQRYKVIFSRRHDQYVAVAETASTINGTPSSSPSSSSSPATSDGLHGLIRGLRFSGMAVLVAMSMNTLVHAQIIADHNAPKNQQATVLVSGNGVPVVNIKTPSASGVSVNTFSQFDVNQNGAILNNARSSAATQLGGYVQGNPWLSTGPARVIVNQVNSSNPSYLRGYVEVAGSKADVIIANPAGLVCSGCGFINAGRSTLTTGSPIINGGNLDGYRVRQGTVTIEGAGLDGTGSDYTSIITRAAKINAGIWAKKLEVLAGANTVNAGNTQITPDATASAGDKPQIAIDVAQLGGMYAQHIYLVANEHGVGVRNDGTIGASVGEVVVTADGRLENRGKIAAANALKVQTADEVSNTGTLGANNAVTVQAASVQNSGQLNSSQGSISTTADKIANQGRIEAAQSITLTGALDNSNGLINADRIAIDTHQQAFDNTAGAVAAQSALSISSGVLNNDAGLLQSRGNLNIDTHGQTLTNTHSGTTQGIVSEGAITIATGDINNREGYVGAASDLIATAKQIDNTSGTIGSTNTAITVDKLTNTSGKVQGKNSLKVNAQDSIDNTSGLLRADGKVDLTAKTLINDNTSGKEQGIEAGAVAIAADHVSNKAGAMRTDMLLDIAVTKTLDNTAGLLSSAGKVAIHDPNAARALAITNETGTMIAGQQLDITTATADGKGKLLSQKDLSLDVASDLKLAGQVGATNNATIKADGDLVNAGSVAAGGNLKVAANHIDNQRDGKLLGNNVDITANDTLTNRGLIDGTDVAVSANTINNIGTGRLYGDNLSIAANTVNNGAETIDGKTTAAVIAARNRLDIGANTLNNSEHGLIYSAGDMAIGGQLDKDNQATGRAGTINNSSATINAEGNLTLAADVINNTNAHLETTEETSQGKRIVTFRLNGSTQILKAGEALIYHKDSGELIAPENWHAMGDEDNFKLLLPSAQYPFEQFGPPYTYSKGAQIPGISMPGVNIAYVPSYTKLNQYAQTIVIPEIYNYAPGGRIWGVFGITPPVTAIPIKPLEPTYFYPCDGAWCITDHFEEKHAAWKVAYAQWEIIHKTEIGKYETLNRAIEVFNQDVQSRLVDEWTIYDGTEKITKTVVTKSDPGMITSGGNMQLNAGTVNNTASQYIAGGNVAGDAVNGTRVNNIGPQGTQKVVTEGAATYTFIRKPNGHGPQRRYLDAPYQSQTIETNFALDITPTNGTGPNRSDAVKAVPATVTAETAKTGTGQANQPRPVTGADGASQIRTTNPNLTLPNNALYRIETIPGNRYLVETDPQFTNYKKWLSSDYMLDQIKRSPDAILKRLGDGYYEQQLIQQQIQQTTGQRYLVGYTSNEAQYMALMNAGVQMAKAFNYEPGIALSDAQMAQLTSDIVWMVKQTVTLTDGSTQEVLAPQMYLRTNKVQVTGQGTLIAANNVALNTAQEIVNSGTIAARNNVTITARDIDNQSGRIAADNVGLTATQDINNRGGAIDGTNTATLRAGRDIKIDSTTVNTANATTTGSNINRVASVTGGDITIAAARDISANAAVIAGTGNTTIAAGRDVNLGTVNEHYRQEINWASDSGGSNMVGILTGPNFVDDANGAHGTKETGVNRATLTGSKNVATQITGNNIAIHAGQDLSTQGTQVIADQALVATAGNNINISTANVSASARDQHQHSESGILSSTTKQTDDSSSYSRNQGSTFSGNTTLIAAGNNVSVTGSDVVSTKGTQIAAGNDVSIKSATDTSSEAHYRRETTSGVFSSGMGLTVGSKMQSTDQTRKTETASASTIGAIDGNVSIAAGNAYLQTGSDVLAPQGNIDIHAKKVDINAATETERTTQDIKFKQQGVTLQITSPVISAIQTVQQMDEAASSTSDSRTRALAQANKLFAGKNVYDAIQAGQGSVINDKPNQILTGEANGKLTSRDANAADKVGGINIAISLGASSSESHVEQNATHAKGSTVAAGGNVNISAQGGGAASNLIVQGSDIKASNNLTLKAENEVKLLAAQNTSEQNSNNKNISGSVGVSFGTDGLMFNAGLSGGKGHGDGTEVTQTNTHANAGNKLTISSGTDTTLSGAVASGKQVEVNVGTNGQGNLNIASLQDTSNYHSSQQQMGGSISVGAGKMSGSVSASHSKVDATYASVIEQSGINAGDNGFQVKVNGNTDLKGGKIASTDKAIADGKNSLATQTLTTSDIQNHSSYDAESHSASLSGGYTGSQAALNRPGLGYGSAGGSQSSTTQSGISEIADDKTVRSDKYSSNKLAKAWDGQALQQDVTVQAQVMQTALPQLAKAIGDVATQQMKEALERGDAEAVEKWKDGGLYRVALHTLLGALSGGAAGATGAAATAISVPEIATAIKNLGLPEGITNTLIAAAGTAVGAVAGGAQGAAIGFNQTANNFLKHADAEAMKKEVDQCKAKSGGCKDGEVTDIVKKYKAISDANIAAVDSCVLAGNVKCVQDSLGQVASTSEVKVLPFGYTKLEDSFISRQNNVITYGAVRGDASLFGSDVDQAKEVATFRQNNCSGMAALACDNLVKQAMAYRMGRMLSLAAASSAVAAATNAAKGSKPPVKENLESETTGTGIAKANSGEAKPGTGIADTEAETAGGVRKNDQPSSGTENSASKGADKTLSGAEPPEKPAVVPSKVSEEIEALKRIKNNPDGPNLENKVPNSVLNQQAVKDLQNGKLPGTPIGEPWTPREMSVSPNPSATAEDFAMQFFGGKAPTSAQYIKQGLADIGGRPCPECWVARASDGTIVTYRPTGFASDGTLPTTASVDLNNPTTINRLNINKRGKPDIVKLKFPLIGKSGVEK